ncbi:MAG: phosphatidate cytidylyltransferase [Lachnospiraceae bacterium]|nr:phosphatidate cytidylyltransferase [Lachnospiraceae bacterium]
MFVKRLISGICLLVILAVGLVLGGDILLALGVFISVVGFYEMMRGTGTLGETDEKGKGATGALFLVGVAGIVAYYFLLALADGRKLLPEQVSTQIPMLCVTAVVIAILVVYVLTFPKYKAEQIMATVFSFVYAPMMLSYIYRTRCLEQGVYLVWLIFISSWMCDTSAYVVGMLIGKHKMAPKLSPKKSVEGGIGGIVGAALLGFVYGLILKKMGMIEENALYFYPLIAGVGGLISQIGDLAASAVKRNYKIKDYGKLIPGHGGILDRFDSVIFTAPIIYYLALLFM